MKQTIKFILKTISVLFLFIGLIPFTITMISSFFYFMCDEIRNWADLKARYYEYN